MKNSFKLALLMLAIATFTSCTTVDSGHRGVEVSWGGETNMNKVYEEGAQYGFSWIFNSMVEYNVKEQTLSKRFEFNDKNNMATVVELALDYRLIGEKVNLLHKNIDDYETKLLKTLASAGKEVIPQYSAVELNISKRTEAEDKLSKILAKELPEFYLDFVRLQMTDVDLPPTVAKMAEKTAEQLEKNKLAEKMEAEKVALAKALVAEASGKLQAAEYDAKRKEILSKPEMLKLKQLDILQTYAEKGASPYGNNNVFGEEPQLFKTLK